MFRIMRKSENGEGEESQFKYISKYEPDSHPEIDSSHMALIDFHTVTDTA